MNLSDYKFKSIKHFILSHNKIQFNEFAKAGLADLLKINRHIGWLVLNNNERLIFFLFFSSTTGHLKRSIKAIITINIAGIIYLIIFF